MWQAVSRCTNRVLFLGVFERDGGIIRVSSWFFSRPECMMGRELSLSSLCQLTLPVTSCLPLIHTPLQQSARKRARGKKKTPMIPFFFSRAAFKLLFPSMAAHALCLKVKNTSYGIDWLKVLIGFILIFFNPSELWLAVRWSHILIWPYVCT